MKNGFYYLICFFIFLFSSFNSTKLFAQAIDSSRQEYNIIGQVQTKFAGTAIKNAKVELLGYMPIKIAETDSLGYFKLKNISLGRYRLLVTANGYADMIIPDVLVNSGQNTQISTIGMEEQLETTSSEIIVTPPKIYKDVSYNDFSLASVQPFTINEVGRYAGARFDPMRLISAFAGIRTYNGIYNGLIVRGASPLSNAFFINGMPIKRISHFANYQYNIGGSQPLLNFNLMDNSEFLMGNFSAEYGNALLGVFDIRLRTGNTERVQGIFQSGLAGTELTIEAPLSKIKKSSFIVSLRQATFFPLIKIISKSDVLPLVLFSDINLKMDFPNTKIGDISLFMVGGYSHLKAKPSGTNSNIANFTNNEEIGQGMAFLQHKFFLNKLNTSYIQTKFAVNYYQNLNLPDSLGRLDSIFYTYGQEKNLEIGYSLSSYWHKKVKKQQFRVGFLSTLYKYNITHILYNPIQLPTVSQKGTTLYSHLYVIWHNRIRHNLILNLGVNAAYLSLNNTYAVMPRVALRWEFALNHTLIFASGLYSNMQPFYVYFQRQYGVDSTVNLPNYNLKFTQTFQNSLAYQWRISENWRFKLEGYYNLYFNVPIATDSSNRFNLYDIQYTPPSNVPNLASKGKGWNYGLELSVERFFDRSFYVRLCASVFDTKYSSSDGKIYNSSFNTSYIFTVLGGKEFRIGKKKRNIFFTDIRFSYTKGFRFTPIDLAASQNMGYEVRNNAQYMQGQLKDFISLDIKIGARFNARRISHYFFLDMLNALQRKNEIQESYNYRTGTIYHWIPTQSPYITYRLEF